MPVLSISCALLEPRVAALVKHLPEALNGGVKSVHQARVASRRLREALPVVGAAAGPRRLRNALRRVRAVTRALGPVRELDVTLGLLDEIGGAHAALAAPVRVVRRAVAAEREWRRTAMLELVGSREAERTCEAVQDVLRKLGKVRDDGEWRGPLAARAFTRGERLLEAVHDGGLLFDPARLHQVRIAVKKLRYALELAREAGLSRTAAAVATLKAVQEQLGRLHDLQVLLVFSRIPEASGALRYRRSLSALRDLIERDCHREHARYLKRRPRLLRVCETVSELFHPETVRAFARRSTRAPA